MGTYGDGLLLWITCERLLRSIKKLYIYIYDNNVYNRRLPAFALFVPFFFFFLIIFKHFLFKYLPATAYRMMCLTYYNLVFYHLSNTSIFYIIILLFIILFIVGTYYYFFTNRGNSRKFRSSRSVVVVVIITYYIYYIPESKSPYFTL